MLKTKIGGLVLLCGLIATGCMMVRKPTQDELHALDNPPPAVAAKLGGFLPKAKAWVAAVEADLLSQGRPLTQGEQETARRLGVHQPEQVRVVVLEKFPLPEDAELRREAEKYGMGGPFEGGRTMGYLIMLKPRYADDATVLRHELTHVAQHDRIGREAFIRRYLVEMEIMGYARSPLELEAYEKQGKDMP